MIIARRSRLTGAVNKMDLPITNAQLTRWVNDPTLMVQDAFPSLSAGEREFLISGSTPEEWDRLIPPDDEDEA